MLLPRGLGLFSSLLSFLPLAFPVLNRFLPRHYGRESIDLVLWSALSKCVAQAVTKGASFRLLSNNKGTIEKVGEMEAKIGRKVGIVFQMRRPKNGTSLKVICATKNGSSKQSKNTFELKFYENERLCENKSSFFVLREWMTIKILEKSVLFQ